MRKKLYLFPILITISFGLVGCNLPTVFWQQSKPAEPVISQEVAIPSSMHEETAQPFIAQNTVQVNPSDEGLTKSEKEARIIVLTKKAEYLMGMSEYKEAMGIYERIFRLDPDPDREKKLAHIAYLAKDFQRSSDLYKKYQSDLYQSEKEELLHALRYTHDDAFLEAMKHLTLSPEIHEAFTISWKCEYEYISCEEAIRGALYTSDYVVDLKKALQNYENLGNKDSSYKEALLLGAMYRHEDFSTAMKIGEGILKKRSDYRPVLKIVGFSSFMIGQDERAQGVLGRYKKLEPKDPEADFILGILFFEKADYDTSNIYFNKAILSGYQPKIVVERKLAYNYYVLGMIKNMFQVLGYLMLEPDLNELDTINSIYLALEHDEVRLAGEWLKVGREKYPNSENIRALAGWYERLIGNVAEAQSITDAVLNDHPENLIALIQNGILAYESGFAEKSKTIFNKARIIDAGGTWAKTIQEYLDKLTSSK